MICDACASGFRPTHVPGKDWVHVDAFSTYPCIGRKSRKKKKKRRKRRYRKYDNFRFESLESFLGVEISFKWKSVIRKDVCSYCGYGGGTVDHIIADSKGGKLSPDNMAGACSDCNNNRKGNLSLLDFLRAGGMGGSSVYLFPPGMMRSYFDWTS